MNPLYHCPHLSERFSVRCNEAVFSTFFHEEINLDEAKGGQQVPLKDFTVQNDYLSDHFCKDFEVTSKHTYRRHIFLVWFKVLNMSSSFCAEVLMILLDKLLIGKPWCKIADKIFSQLGWLCMF